MVREINNKFQCGECKFFYKDRVWAESVDVQISEDEDWFDVTELSRFSREMGLNFTVSKYDEDYPSFVYTIYTEEEGIFPIYYRFANKLSWPDFYFPESGF